MKQWILGTAFAVGMTACGGNKDDKKDAGPEVIYSTVKVANAPASDDVGDTTLTFNKVDSCTLDAETGLFQASFSSGSMRPTLGIKIKGFSTQAKTYTCGQASDNKGPGAVGAKYDTCAVQLQTLFSATGSTLNKYVMYRDVETMEALSYTGNCEISISYNNPKVEGSITCSKLIQSERNGAARNPIDPTVTADIAEGSAFSCDIQ